MNSPCLPIAVAFAVLVSGCGPESAPPRQAEPGTDQVGPGLPLNGTAVTAGGTLKFDECRSEALSGSPVPYAPCHNGPLLSSTLAWVNLSGVTLSGGQPLDGPAVLVGAMLSGTAGGVAKQGADFIGASLTGRTTGGGVVSIRIDGALQDTGEHSDVWEYGLSYEDSSGSHPVCASGAKGVPVLGRWDYSQGTATGGDKIDDPTVFTVGCIGSAIAKCVYLGYKPWKTVSGVNLANHHQACTRAIRADYCGNGESNTRAGRIIDIYDHIGIQSDAADGYIPEGEWNPGGARCTNLLNRDIIAGLLCHPTRFLGCGQWTPGTLLLTQSPLVLLGLPKAEAGVATQPR